MGKETAYFVATGRSLAGIERWLADYKAAGEDHVRFVREVDGVSWTTELFDDGNRITAVEFGVAPGKAWRKYVKSRNPMVFCPNKTTAEGKTVLQKMETLAPLPTDWQLIDYVMPPEDQANRRVWDLENKRVFSRCQAERIGAAWVLLVNYNNNDPPIQTPLDAKPIDTETYQSMVEEAKT